MPQRRPGHHVGDSPRKLGGAHLGYFAGTGPRFHWPGDAKIPGMYPTTDPTPELFSGPPAYDTRKKKKPAATPLQTGVYSSVKPKAQRLPPQRWGADVGTIDDGKYVGPMGVKSTPSSPTPGAHAVPVTEAEKLKAKQKAAQDLRKRYGIWWS